MARIRTIKPEFPQSESMGRISREARLTFILLWTAADDEGRLRAGSGALAASLFPYDADAPVHIGVWLDELEREGCIRRYRYADAPYLSIRNWLKHQKIDRPTRSRLPVGENLSESATGSVGQTLQRIPQRVECTGMAPCAPTRAETAPSPTPLQLACRATWQAYATAYAGRYGAPPVRNARTNAQILQFVQRLGQNAAPAVAAFYVGHADPVYRRGGHAVGPLLADAEKLHTEWLTGRPLWQSGATASRDVQRTLAATTRLADLVNDDGTPRNLTGDFNGNAPHTPRLVD